MKTVKYGFRTMLYVLVIAGVTGCSAKPTLTPMAARERLVSALPPGWHLAREEANAAPFAQEGPVGKMRGWLLIAEGPMTVKVSGYYCQNSFCAEQPAREAIEIWIMPPHYVDGAGAFRLQALLSPEEITRNRGSSIWGTATRLLAGGRAFDAELTDASQEARMIGCRTKDKLPVSWCNWQSDIKRALEAR